MVTMKDIAEITGVSISTVSRVLNNKGNISEEVKRKVLSASEEMMFKKGVVSQTLEQIHYALGLIVPKTGEYFHNDPATSTDLRSIQNVLEQIGHTTHIFFYTMDDEQNAGLIQKIRQAGIDGLIISDPQAGSNLVDMIVAEGIPYVIMNGVFNDRKLFQIDYDNYSGMKDLSGYVIERGHKRFLVLAGPEAHMVTKNRLDGLQDCFREKGISTQDYQVVFGDFSLESGYKRAKEFLTKNKEITCIIAFSDYIAMGAMRAIKEQGMVIPRDMSITGFDDIEMACYTDPPLTTVRRYSPECAPRIVQDITERISRNKSIAFSSTFFKTELIERETVNQIQ